jgi:hypothetical protein
MATNHGPHLGNRKPTLDEYDNWKPHFEEDFEWPIRREQWLIDQLQQEAKHSVENGYVDRD